MQKKHDRETKATSADSRKARFVGEKTDPVADFAVDARRGDDGHGRSSLKSAKRTRTA